MENEGKIPVRDEWRFHRDGRKKVEIITHLNQCQSVISNVQGSYAESSRFLV